MANFVQEEKQQQKESLRFILQLMLICMRLQFVLEKLHQVVRKEKKKAKGGIAKGCGKV
jgi:hypothetical protein